MLLNNVGRLVVLWPELETSSISIAQDDGKVHKVCCLSLLVFLAICEQPAILAHGRGFRLSGLGLMESQLEKWGYAILLIIARSTFLGLVPQRTARVLLGWVLRSKPVLTYSIALYRVGGAWELLDVRHISVGHARGS